MMKQYLLLVAVITLAFTSTAQQPSYTVKHFVNEEDTLKFKPTPIVKNGFVRSYVKTKAAYFDVDDNNTTHIRGSQMVLLCLESNFRNGRRSGLTRQFLIDSANPSRRYLIAEQTYENDKLNGVWKVYNLNGTLVKFEHYKNDSLDGLARDYWIDGKAIMGEREYFNGSNKLVLREFFKSGNVHSETMYVNGMPNGEVKVYYESGVVEDRFMARNGMRHGLRTYYYPSGKPWIEVVYQNNKPWTIVANYDSKGNKRDGGTLKDGNGTMIYYEDDVKVRQISTYTNGEER